MCKLVMCQTSGKDVKFYGKFPVALVYHTETSDADCQQHVTHGFETKLSGTNSVQWLPNICTFDWFVGTEAWVNHEHCDNDLFNELST